MSLKIAYIGLGSNLGDRLTRMRTALNYLEEHRGIFVEQVSPVYENPAVGMEAAPDFLNAAARLQTLLTPEELLIECLAVETRLGRIRADQWVPRTIDLDILFYEDVALDTPRLQLPHPRIASRDFVARPLFDLDPSLCLSGKPIREILGALMPSQMSVYPEYLR